MLPRDIRAAVTTPISPLSWLSLPRKAIASGLRTFSSETRAATFAS